MKTATLPEVATIGAAEETLRVFFRELGSTKPESLTIDFSNCRYVEVSTLMFVIALMADRLAAKPVLETKLRLPRAKSVRDFMRAWNFPEAVLKATQRSFYSLVRDEDLKFFGENKSPLQLTYKCKFLDESVSRLVSQNFFAILTLTPAQMSRTRLVTEESKRWESELVRSVLGKHLDGPDTYMASRIVYESMTNAARHPGATVIQTASKFNAPREERGDKAGHFTITFWDNGRSMIDTLLEAIVEGKQIRSRETPELYRDHILVLKDHSGKKQREYVLSSKNAPSANDPEYEVLFATTFPGISRDAEGKEHEVHSDLQRDHPALTLPGMGLYVLLNAVIDVFKGSISFRTKDSFMNIKKAASGSGATYRAKIQNFDPVVFPTFKGNLVTVRLPLRQHTSDR